MYPPRVVGLAARRNNTGGEGHGNPAAYFRLPGNQSAGTCVFCSLVSIQPRTTEGDYPTPFTSSSSNTNETKAL